MQHLKFNVPVCWRVLLSTQEENTKQTLGEVRETVLAGFEPALRCFENTRKNHPPN